ncbi:hypothetical protein [Aeromicrobium sp.]
MILYVLVIASIVVCGAAMVRPQARMLLGLIAAVLVGVAVVTRVVVDVDVPEEDLLGLFGLVLAVIGGSVVTTAAFKLIDGHNTVEAETLQAAGKVLRGGTWIGMLERFVVFATLVAGYPAGIAYALAIKGLGRYPELRNQKQSGTAERFIIGTMISVIWAGTCAYVTKGL